MRFNWNNSLVVVGGNEMLNRCNLYWLNEMTGDGGGDTATTTAAAVRANKQLGESTVRKVIFVTADAPTIWRVDGNMTRLKTEWASSLHLLSWSSNSSVVCVCAVASMKDRQQESERERERVRLIPRVGEGKRKFQWSRAQQCWGAVLSAANKWPQCCRRSLSLLSFALCNRHWEAALWLRQFAWQCREPRPAFCSVSLITAPAIVKKNSFERRHHLTSAMIHTFSMVCLL